MYHYLIGYVSKTKSKVNYLTSVNVKKIILKEHEKESKEKERLLRLQEREENLPSAIRSSFLIGESAPRSHAFSAKKRQEQKRF